MEAETVSLAYWISRWPEKTNSERNKREKTTRNFEKSYIRNDEKK